MGFPESVSALAAAYAMLLSWLGAPVEEKPRHPLPPVPEQPECHRRMLAELDAIAARVPEETPFLEDRTYRTLKTTLVEMPSNAPPEQRFDVLSKLADAALILGHNEESVERAEEALALVAKLPQEGRRGRHAQTLLRIAMAWFRVGETANCVNCHNHQRCMFPIQGQGVHEEKRGSENAVRTLEKLLEVVPGDPTARWLLNLAHMTLGTFPEGVAEKWRISPERLVSAEEFPRFHDVAATLGVDFDDLSGGAISEDFDGDGFLDLLTSTFDPRGPMHYMHNEGDGRFSDWTQAGGLEGLRGGLNMVQADYDNDGDIDVFVLRGAWMRNRGQFPKSLLRNNGNGTFSDVTLASGLQASRHPTQTATWGDYDNDGDLDLYVGNESSPEHVCASELYRNDGNGSFTDVAKAAGVENLRYSKGTVFGDYDNDRWPDLYVSNLGAENRMYHNNRDGTFTDVAPQKQMTKPSRSFPTWFFDFDNDGDLDLYVAAYSSFVGFFAASFFGEPHEGELPCLYVNDGHGNFRDAARELGLTDVNFPMGSNFGDLDSDGWLDFYLGTGYPGFEGLTPNVMYHNREGKRFVDVTNAGGFGHLQKGHGIAFADFDQDGDQDVFEQMGGAYAADGFRDVLYENPGFSMHWIAVRCVGVESNRCAIGTRIRCQFTENGKQRSVYKHVNSGGSFGCNSLRQHVGLGAATTIDVLEVEWPKSGKSQTFRDVPVDQFIEITEGLATWKRLPYPSFRFTKR